MLKSKFGQDASIKKRFLNLLRCVFFFCQKDPRNMKQNLQSSPQEIMSFLVTWPTQSSIKNTHVLSRFSLPKKLCFGNFRPKASQNMGLTDWYLWYLPNSQNFQHMVQYPDFFYIPFVCCFKLSILSPCSPCFAWHLSTGFQHVPTPYWRTASWWRWNTAFAPCNLGPWRSQTRAALGTRVLHLVKIHENTTPTTWTPLCSCWVSVMSGRRSGKMWLVSEEGEHKDYR